MIGMTYYMLHQSSWGHNQTPKVASSIRKSPTVALSHHVKIRENY